MKFLLPTVVGLALCTMSLRADMACQEEQMGDTFATVQKGDSKAYASAYGDAPQDIIFANVYTPVEFPSDDLDPKNIDRPSGDGTEFKICKKGVYLIAWDLSVTVSDSNPPTNVFTRLLNVKTNGPYAPEPLQEQRFLTVGSQVVAGQKILALREGDVLRLELLADTPDASLLERAIVITKIAVQEGDSEKAYASAYNASNQAIPTGLLTPLAFAINGLDPKNIDRPSGDGTEFKICKKGVYLIAWNYTVTELFGSDVQTHLFNVTTNTEYAPFVLQRQGVDPNGTEVVAGYKILVLRKGDILRLETLSSGNNTVVNPAAIAFIKIAD